MRKRQVEAVMSTLIALILVYTVGNITITARDLSRALREKAALTAEIEDLWEANALLEQELLKAEDPSVMEQMARQKLGLVRQGEKIFCDIHP